MKRLARTAAASELNDDRNSRGSFDVDERDHAFVPNPVANVVFPAPFGPALITIFAASLGHLASPAFCHAQAPAREVHTVAGLGHLPPQRLASDNWKLWPRRMTEVQLHGNPLRVFVDTDEGSREVDLRSVTLAKFFSGDLVRYRFTGAMPLIANLNLSNFIESVLVDFSAQDVDFQECDFKDCVIRASEFRDCNFDNNSFSTNLISRTVFVNCTFRSSGIHACELRDVTFEDCDFTNLLIKSSRFTNCRFIRCRTVNKIFEMSLLDNSTFERTNIQIDTITSNFGLTMANLVDSGVRTGRVRTDHHVLDPHELADIARDSLSDIEQLRLDYFLNPDLTGGSVALDSTLDVTRWARIYKNPGSFVDLFGLFSEFIVHIFDRGQTTLQTVLMLHHVTDTLSSELALSDDPNLRRIAISFGGAHLMLSRIVDRFLILLEAATALASANQNTVSLLVDGPLDRAYFRQVLAKWLPRNRAKIVKLIPHNSPLDMVVAFATVSAMQQFIAMVLSTRVSLEIFAIERDSQAAAHTHSPKGRRRQISARSAIAAARPKAHREKVFALEWGPNRKRGGLPLRINSMIPGSMMIDLKINFGSRVAGQLRRLVRAFHVSKG